MYTMIARSVITYGTEAWASRTELSTARRPLDKVQRLSWIYKIEGMRFVPHGSNEGHTENRPHALPFNCRDSFNRCMPKMAKIALWISPVMGKDVID